MDTIRPTCPAEQPHIENLHCHAAPKCPEDFYMFLWSNKWYLIIGYVLFTAVTLAYVDGFNEACQNFRWLRRHNEEKEKKKRQQQKKQEDLAKQREKEEKVKQSENVRNYAIRELTEEN